MPGALRALAAGAVLGLATGCESFRPILRARYDEPFFHTRTTQVACAAPAAAVRFAAQEALIMVGCDQITALEGGGFRGRRRFLVGLIVGQGKEEIDVRLTERTDGLVAVSIESKKPYPYFFAPVLLDAEVASALARCLKENQALLTFGLTPGSTGEAR